MNAFTNSEELKIFGDLIDSKIGIACSTSSNMIFLSTSSLVVPLLLFVGVFLCLNFFVGRFCAVTFLVCVEFEVLLMPYSVVLGLSPFTVCLVLASSLSRAAAAISFLRACF